MDIQAIKERLERAVSKLYANQPNIFELTSETGQTEWNLAHHYANEVHKLFPEFDCDLEVSKVNLNRMRPDVVIHARGNNDLNVLVIEIKKDGDETEIGSDIQKITSAWFGRNLNYRFGAVVNLLRNKTGQVKVFLNPNH